LIKNPKVYVHNCLYIKVFITSLSEVRNLSTLGSNNLDKIAGSFLSMCVIKQMLFNEKYKTYHGLGTTFRTSVYIVPLWVVTTQINLITNIKRNLVHRASKEDTRMSI